MNHYDKAARINRVKNTLTEKKLLRRLPEIDAIYDEELRDGTIRTFLDGCPPYFWEKPSSSSGKYHSPDERGEYGNWLHTKRVFARYVTLSSSLYEAGEISGYEREAGKSAALIHDMMKYGWLSSNNQHTVNDHDIIAAAVAKEIGDLPAAVYKPIERHMGSWGEGPTPSSQHEWLLHLADKSASGIEEDNLAVYYPSDELVEAFPHLNVIDHDSEEPV